MSQDHSAEQLGGLFSQCLDTLSQALPAAVAAKEPLIPGGLILREHAGGTTSLEPFVAPELAGFSLSKGTIRFTGEHPLPVEVLDRIIRLRAAEIEQVAPFSAFLLYDTQRVVKAARNHPHESQFAGE